MGTEHYVLRGSKRYKVKSPFAVTQIRVKARLAKDKLSAYALVGVRSAAYYALSFVELGTSKQAKQPWLRPAFLGAASEQISRMKTHMARTISNEAKKAKKVPK